MLHGMDYIAGACLAFNPHQSGALSDAVQRFAKITCPQTSGVVKACLLT
jgi:hypothetical protein